MSWLFLLGMIAKCRIRLYFYDSPWKMQGRCRSICADVFDFVHLRADLNVDLPVIGERVLRADLKKRHFARKREPGFTGRFEKTEICP